MSVGNRHGTVAGYAAHRRAGKRPCGPCFAARAAYDKKRLANSETGRRNARVSSQARVLAQRWLRHAHRAEYDQLYQRARIEVLQRQALDQEVDISTTPTEEKLYLGRAMGNYERPRRTG